MAYLSINGLTVDVARANPVKARRKTKGRERTGITGDVTEARRGSKGAWDITTIPLPPNEAESLENLLLGRGHRWTLAGDLASSGAAGIRSHAAALVVRYTFAGAPYAGTDGAYQIRIFSGTTVDFRAGLTGARWTILASKGSAFTGVRSSGNAWRGGIDQGVTSYPWVSRQGNGDVRLEGKLDDGSNAFQDYGQLVALPWLAPDAHMKAWTAWTTRRWGPLPLLDCSGDFIPQTAIFARARFAQSTHSRAANTSGTVQPRRALSFTLTEA